ncbi:MAG: sulfatase [Opitutaceae bacterium]|jgi:iduronate 2-sulfatase|nr:sulfatase [Opitutaceae bacterium]
MKTSALTSIAVIGGVAAATCPAATTAVSRPNVLYITVDDLRLNLRCFGDTAAITPNIDALAARGTRFARAYVQQAVCNPSRQSVLTGCRPDTIRVWDLRANFRKTSPDIIPLPEHFKRNGYFTQGIGKIYHDGMDDPRSWSVPALHASVPKVEDYRLPENRAPRKGQKGQKAAATEFMDAPENEYPDGKVATDAVAAIEKLAARPGAAQPFFLAVGIRKPHAPFTAPKKYWDLYDPAKIPPIERAAPPDGAPAVALHDSVELRGYSDMPKAGDFTPEQIARLRHGYYAATSFADAQIGRVLDALRRTGLDKNTVIVLWGDHGYHLGEHGLWCKTTCYEADTRVPFIIATPDDRPRGVRTDALVEALDIYPTLVELCDLPPREKLEGKSLVPNLGDASASGRDVARSQFPRPWPLKKDGSPAVMGYAARTATHRYVEWRKSGTPEVVARELYAYEGDQLFETENLAARPECAGLVRRLAALIMPKTALLETQKLFPAVPDNRPDYRISSITRAPHGDIYNMRAHDVSRAEMPALPGKAFMTHGPQ